MMGCRIQGQFVHGENCQQAHFEVTCTCNEKKTNFSYDTLEINENLVDLRIEKCTGTVIVQREVLLYFIHLQKIVFSDIDKLVVHTGALDIHHSQLEFHNVKNVVLFKDSITVPGDGKASVTVVDSDLLLSTSEDLDGGVQWGSGEHLEEEVFRCHCQDMYYGNDNPAVGIMKEAVQCSTQSLSVREDDCARAPARPRSSSAQSILAPLLSIYVFTIACLLL